MNSGQRNNTVSGGTVHHCVLRVCNICVWPFHKYLLVPQLCDSLKTAVLC